MPKSKEYSQREMIIDRYLSTGREFSGPELRRLVNEELRSRGMQEITARSTFASDISEINGKFFGRYHRNVIGRRRQGRQFVYFYVIPGFSIYDRALTGKDIADLHNLVATLRRFSGMPQFSWLEALEVRFDQAVLHGAPPTVAFDDSYNKAAMVPFKPLLDAIERRQVVDLAYRRFVDGETVHHLLSPYFLKQYGLRWYLLASYLGDRAIYRFGLDRVVGVGVAEDKTYEPSDIDFEHYFDNIIGVTDYADYPVRQVEIRVAKRLLPYIVSNPLHRTQRILSQEDSCAVIAIDVKWNHELEQAIFTYGDDVEVLEPKQLRDKFCRRVDHLYALYHSGSEE